MRFVKIPQRDGYTPKSVIVEMVCGLWDATPNLSHRDPDRDYSDLTQTGIALAGGGSMFVAATLDDVQAILEAVD